MMSANKSGAQPVRRKNKKKELEFSKRLISDIRYLLWVVTIGGLVLAFYCIILGYTGSLPWISSMVGLPWAAHGTVCSFYMNMAKSDHTGADGKGITYAIAEAKGFRNDDDNWESPPI